MLKNTIKSLIFKSPITISLFILLGVFSIFNFNPKNVSAQYVYTPTNVNTTNATNINASGAILNGLINGNNLYNTYNIITWFEYGPNTNMGYSTVHINANSGYANMSATVSNLSPSTVYYFRAVVQTSQGVLYGQTNSFRTNYGNIYANNNNTYNNSYSTSILTTITNEASSVSSTSANLNSSIFNQNNLSSTTWFEYGKTLELGNKTNPISTGTLPSVKHVNTLTKLAPNTTYYFKAVSENSSLKTEGAVLSFTTGSKTTTSSVSSTSKNTLTSSDIIIPANNNTNNIGSYLGANVFSAGSFFPNNILGWMIILILILLLIFLIRRPPVSANTGADSHGGHH